MSNTWSVITKHTKKQENKIHNDEKGKSIETNPEIMQLIKLAGKDIKTIIINYSFCLVS